MSNRETSQQVTIRPGMSEAIDARMLPIGTPRLVQNYRMRQLGRFEKRPGSTTVDNSAFSGFPSSGFGLFLTQHRGLPVVGVETVSTRRGRYAYTLDGATSSPVWNLLGRHGVVVPERRFGVATDDTNSGRSFTSVAINGIVYMANTDAATGTSTVLRAVDPNGVVLRQGSVSNAAAPRLIYDGTTLYVVYRDSSGAGTTIAARSITLSTLATSGASTVGTLSASTSVFDAAPIEGAATWVLAYPTSAVNLRVVRITGTTVGSTTNQATGAEASMIGVAAYNGEYACVAYLDGTTIEALMVSTVAWVGGNYTVRAAGAGETYTYQCGVVRTTTNTFAIVMGATYTTAAPVLNTGFIAHCRIDNAGTLSGPYECYNYQPASKPFTYGAAGESQVLLWAHDRNGTVGWIAQARHFVLELQPVATSGGGGANLAGVSYEHIATYGAVKTHMPEVASVGSGRFAVLLQWDDPGALAGVDMAVFRACLASESSEWSRRTVLSDGTGVYISGGCLYDQPSATSSSDTRYLSENGFPYAPEIATALAAGGSQTSGTTYTYYAVYRWLDSAGRVQRSAPSYAATSSPSAGNLTTSLRSALCIGTGKIGQGAGVYVEFYRSWSGGPAYYVGDAAAGPANVGTLSDGSSDATISANAPLYTDLGIVPTEPPSGARLMCLSASRMFTVGWRENVVQFSKLYVPTAPWEFCDDDTFRIFLPSAERITALAYLDGTLVIFCERAIYLVTGDGPNDQGVGSYSEPRRLPVSVGADSPQVVETANGLMFKGAGTIWLLPRGFGPPQPIGDDIQETLASYPYLRGAVLCANEDDDCVHFVLADSDTSSATTLVAVWDNRLSAWSLDDIDAEVGAAGAVDGAFSWVLPTWSSTNVYPARKFDSTVRYDLDSSGATSWIQSKIGFGDWRPFGPLGQGSFARLVILGERAGTHVLKVDTSVDGAAAYTVTRTVSSGTQIYAQHDVRTQRATSWRFDIYDAESSGKTAGFVLNAVAFEAEPEEGTRRIASGERLT